MANEGQSRPTLWIGIAVVCALAAIGLGIWAFSTKSDLDDANAKIDKLEQQSTSQEAAAASTEANDLAKDVAEKARYRRVRRSLISTRRQKENLHRRIQIESGQLSEARTQLANANTVAERRRAQLNVAQQERDVAAACARNSVAAMADFFDASSATVGARAAVKKLQTAQPLCEQALR